MSLPVLGSVSKAMTVAGSDSGAGAGIQADLKTFAAYGVYGTSAVTAITAQNTRGVYAIAEVPDEVIAAQIDVVLEDIGAASVKTGMLSSRSIVETVADRMAAWGVEKLVVDPVMVAKSGDFLLQPDAVEAVKSLLLSEAMLVTPNIPEAETLASMEISNRSQSEEAARIISDLGPKYVVIKGGHASGDPIDLVFDGSNFIELPSKRIATSNTHGTGCTFSAAITAGLANGLEPLAAIVSAKEFITQALSASYAIGMGHSPVNHFHSIRVEPDPVS